MEATATAKFMRVSPRKARLVVDLIRGKNLTPVIIYKDSSASGLRMTGLVDFACFAPSR